MRRKGGGNVIYLISFLNSFFFNILHVPTKKGGQLIDNVNFRKMFDAKKGGGDQSPPPHTT